MNAGDSPIFATLITELGRERSDAVEQASRLQRLLADVEALHEPDANGDCPTCLAPAPCLTTLMLHGEVSVEDAFAVVRDRQPIDLVRDERGPLVPSVAELLATPTDGMDRFFDALLGRRS